MAEARIWRARGEEGRAEKGYRDAVISDPDCHEARIGLAAMLVARAREEEAVRQLIEAVRRGVGIAALSAEPALRMLVARPGIRARLARAAGPQENPP